MEDARSASGRPEGETRRFPPSAQALSRIDIRSGGLGRIEVACPACPGPFRVRLWDWQGRLRREASAKGADLGEDTACLDAAPGTLPGGAYLLGVTASGRVGYRKLVLPL